MDRTLKGPSGIKPRQGQGVFLLPGALEVEPWEIWVAGSGGKSQLAQVCASPRENPWQRRSTFVLPTAQVFCLPLWLNETDAGRLPGMIDLQLESRGLAGRTGSPTIYQWSLAAQEERRTLVLVAMLPADLPAEFQVETYPSFDVSARYLSWPENALTLWREQGRLAAAFTRESHLVYFQNLGEDRCSERILQSLTCLRASLEMQEVLPRLSQIVLWTELGVTERNALEETLKLPLSQEEGPAPRPPERPWNLCPPEVQRSKQAHHTRRWKGRGFLLLGLLYLVILTLVIARFLVLSYQVDALRKWQSDHATALASIQKAQDDWTHLQPVVDTGNYPLEVLHECQNAIPKNSLHFTLFELDTGKVDLKGEATNIAAAYQLFDRLKNEPGLVRYTWKMDEPHLLPNDLAQLQLEGLDATAHP